MDKIARSLLCSIFCLLVPISAAAFDELNEPQTLIYDTDHLTKTVEGSAIKYNYKLQREGEESLTDEVTLVIAKERDENRRDVSVNFLSGDHKLHLPDFDNYRGNPVIIGMLEHLAQSMGFDSGGGALYFRNRIRDQLASKEVVVSQRESDNVAGSGEKIRLTEFSFAPLHNDPYVRDKPELTESKITLTFSEDVPGHLVSIAYKSGPEKKPQSNRLLEFASVQ